MRPREGVGDARRKSGEAHSNIRGASSPVFELANFPRSSTETLAVEAKEDMVNEIQVRPVVTPGICKVTSLPYHLVSSIIVVVSYDPVSENLLTCTPVM